MRYDIKDFKKYFNLYTELRIQENRETVIALVDGVLNTNQKLSIGGVSARCALNGNFGFNSSPNIDNDSIIKAIKNAESNCRIANTTNSNLANYKNFSTPINFEKSFATKKKRYSTLELIDFLKAIDLYIINKYPNLKGRSIRFDNLDMEKVLYTSEESFVSTLTPRTVLTISLRSEDRDGKPIESSDRIGSLGQVEDIYNNSQQVSPIVDKLYKELMDKKEAIFAKAGVHDVILDSTLAGILAHEAIGHTVESDLVIAGSVAGDYVDKQVASELVTLVDFANEAFNNTLPVPIYVDDEGFIAKDVTIIEKGILKNFMHNKLSANILNQTPTGNARAYSFSDEPLIRMRNTCIMPGKDKLNDMIASIEHGYYLLKRSNGQADATSEFMFGVPLAYEIVNGKIGHAIKETTITGVAFNLLKTITMISDDFICNSNSFCGKKQMIPTAMGGPAIKCKVNIGGR